MTEKIGRLAPNETDQRVLRVLSLTRRPLRTTEIEDALAFACGELPDKLS